MIKAFLLKYLELIFWITALVYLAFIDPVNKSHFEICPLKLLGITWCPGCGLGHAISWLLHGDVKNSLRTHWLGIPALLILLYRVVILYFTVNMPVNDVDEQFIINC